jgi:hypothetical protein
MATKVRSRSCRIKRIGKNSGRSSTEGNQGGVRRKSGGQELAPKSLRRQGRKLMTDCSQEELAKIGL